MTRSSPPSSSSSSSPKAPPCDGDDAIPIYDGCSEIDYGALITLLSREPYLPSSIHVRNTLLSGLTSRREPQEALREVRRQQQQHHGAGVGRGDADEGTERGVWWDILKRYQPGLQVGLFGRVPREILLPSATVHPSRGYRGDEEVEVGTSSALWGISILKSPGSRKEGDSESHLARPDLSIWLSAECEIQASARSRADPTWLVPRLDTREEHIRMMCLILTMWFPPALRRFRSDIRRRLDGVRPSLGQDTEAQEVSIIVFAIGEIERKAIYVLSEQHQDLDQGEVVRGKVKADWQNNCYTFQDGKWDGSEESVRHEEDRWLRAEGASRWEVDTLSAESADLVSQSNKLAFPTSHILRKPFLSRLIRDRSGPRSSHLSEVEEEADDVYAVSNEYAKDLQRRGWVAGWVYTHEDVSLASLHVTEAYRRLGASGSHKMSRPLQASGGDAIDPRISIGRMLVALLSSDVARQQRRALDLIGVDYRCETGSEARTTTKKRSPLPVVAESEMDNQGAVAFYHRCDFEVTGLHSWLGVRIWI